MAEQTQNNNRPQGYWRIPELFPKLGADVLRQLEAYYIELIRFNKSLNLISRHTELDADIVHFADCILGAGVVLRSTNQAAIYDVGSGNGLPGIVLAIMDPKRNVALVDSDERKAEFLKLVISRLGLKNAIVIRGRVEDLDEGSVTCMVSRGFANISRALLKTRKACAPGAEYYHFKGSSWVREVGEIPSQICAFWAPRLVEEYDLPVVAVRMAIVLTKRTD